MPPTSRVFIEGLFSDIADHYDLMNDVMSAGLHRLWKDACVQKIIHSLRAKQNISPSRLPSLKSEDVPYTILDMASGTGDISMRLLPFLCTNINHVSARSCKRTYRLIIADPNAAMLKHARKRLTAFAQSLPLAEAVQTEFLDTTAESLDGFDENLDTYVIAFGLRNVSDRRQALEKALRSLRPGGLFFCLEFSNPSSPFLALPYNLYRRLALPLMGQCIAGNREAYAYLSKSIENFPKATILQKTLSEIGFEKSMFWPLCDGIACLHHAFKPH